MKKGLWNVFIIYVATSIEWLFAMARTFVLGENVEASTGPADYLGSIQEALVFAAVFYALTYAGLIRIRSAFGLFLAVFFSDIFYSYAYRPAIDVLNVSALQDSYPLRITVFIVLYALILIAVSYFPKSNTIGASLWPSDEKVYALFKDLFTLFIVGAAFVSIGLAGLTLLGATGYLQVDWDWTAVLLLVQAVALPVAAVIYLLMAVFFSYLLVEKERLATAGSSAYIGLYSGLLPIVGTVMLVKNSALASFLFVFLATNALYGGILTYVNKERPGVKAFLWVVAAVALLILVVTFSFSIVTLLPTAAPHSALWTIYYTFWIMVMQALPVLLAFPLVSLPIAGVLFAGIYRLFRDKTSLPKRFYGYIGAGVLFPLIISLIGALFFDTDNVAISYVVLVALGTQLLLSCYYLYREKNFRLLVLAIGSIFMLWSLASAFVAGMAIANDWI